MAMRFLPEEELDVVNRSQENVVSSASSESTTKHGLADKQKSFGVSRPGTLLNLNPDAHAPPVPEHAPPVPEHSSTKGAKPKLERQTTAFNEEAKVVIKKRGTVLTPEQQYSL